MADQKTILSKVRQKNDQGSFDASVDIGLTYKQVIDDTTGYSLKQFYNNYLQFMNSSYFMYTGAEQPVNSKTLLWIDTGSTPAID